MWFLNKKYFISQNYRSFSETTVIGLGKILWKFEHDQIIFLEFTGWLVGWLVVLRINVDLAIFQPYLDFEAGDNQSLKIQVARPGIEPRSSCSASQELNHSATAAPEFTGIESLKYKEFTGIESLKYKEIRVSGAKLFLRSILM